jgi:hypothetical protein
MIIENILSENYKNNFIYFPFLDKPEYLNPQIRVFLKGKYIFIFSFLREKSVFNTSVLFDNDKKNMNRRIHDPEDKKIYQLYYMVAKICYDEY